MRWYILLLLPIALISWISPTAKHAHSYSPAPASGDTLKLDSLVFSDFFSPNGDGNNDTYVILNVEGYPSNNSLKVFNRWGEVVYLASPYLNDWNGTNNRSGALLNKELPDGVYYFEFYNGKGNKANGKITIKR